MWGRDATHSLIHDDLPLLLELLDLMRQLDLLTPEFKQFIPDLLIPSSRFLGQWSICSVLGATSWKIMSRKLQRKTRLA